MCSVVCVMSDMCDVRLCVMGYAYSVTGDVCVVSGVCTCNFMSCKHVQQ